MELEIKRIKPILEQLYEIERLKHQVFHLKTDDSSIKTSYDVFHAVHNQLIPFGLYLDGSLIGGCYVSCYGDSLFINYLFIKEEYQNSGLRLGRYLLERVLELKPIFEEYFKKEFNVSRLTANNDKSRSIYEKLGYSSEGRTPFMSKKI